MTFASLAQPFGNHTLSTPVRYLAGLIGAFLVAAFLHEAVRHPAEGWLGAILCGLPMIWLIQSARTGSTQNWESIVWYAVWYAVFASSWVVARALEGPAPGWELSPQAGIGVFLGSIVLVGGASCIAEWNDIVAARRRGPGGARRQP